MNKFTVTTKKVGAKTRYTIFADGVEIGSRTTARPYRFALVVTRSQPHALEQAKRNLEYARWQHAEYSHLASSPEARQEVIRKAKSIFERQVREKWAAGNEYATWAKSQKAEIERLEERIRHLEAGPQPEYSEPFVSSWHSATRHIPLVKPGNNFVTVVELPEVAP